MLISLTIVVEEMFSYKKICSALSLILYLKVK